MHKMMNVKNLGLCLRPEVQKAPDQCGESNSCRNSKYYHHLPWDYQRVECVQAHTVFAYLTQVLGEAAIAVSWSNSEGIVVTGSTDYGWAFKTKMCFCFCFFLDA